MLAARTRRHPDRARRFDTLQELVCGTAQPGQWQAQVLVHLATVEGRDDLPAEIPGLGPVTAGEARELLTHAELRRVVIDPHGRLVAVDSQVHRPDLATGPAPAAAPVDTPIRGLQTDDKPEPVEPDPDAPTAEDLTWLEAHTHRREVYADDDTTRARTARAGRTHPTDEPASAGAVDPDTVPDTSNRPLVPAGWSAAAPLRALHRLRTDPISTLGLSADRYAVPLRLKRHLILRDRTCVFPGCPRRAETCDKDHLLPWPHGRTTEPNLANQCEHHHQAKHDRFTVTRLTDGTFRWTTPAGHTHDRPPRPVLDHLGYPRPPDVQFGGARRRG